MIVYPAAEPAPELFEQVEGAVQYGGLPVHFVESRGDNRVSLLCFEMSRDADIDPLHFLKDHSIRLPPHAREIASPAHSCFAADAELQGLPPQQAEAVEAVEAMPTIGAFRVRLRVTAASPSEQDYSDRVLASFATQGLPQQTPPGGAFAPLVRGDPRPVLVHPITSRGAVVEIGRLDGRVCAALFDAMDRSQSFIPEPDDQTPTLVRTDIRGGPPPHYLLESMRLVSTPNELCDALRPAFARWSVNPAD